MHNFASKGENTIERKIELTSDKGRGNSTRRDNCCLEGGVEVKEDFKETVLYFHLIITPSSSMRNRKERESERVRVRVRERESVCVCVE